MPSLRTIEDIIEKDQKFMAYEQYLPLSEAKKVAKEWLEALYDKKWNGVPCFNTLSDEEKAGFRICLMMFFNIDNSQEGAGTKVGSRLADKHICKSKPIICLPSVPSEDNYING